MNEQRFQEITGSYARLRIAVVGDFCLDRYLEIDPAKPETSIETGLPVYNVTNVRAQPGGAGTVLNNLVALGVGTIIPVGFAGEDGEGYELCRALAAKPGVCMDHFLQTCERHTFSYCKPLVVEPAKAPRELNRLDQKNWTPTPATLEERLRTAVAAVADRADALILLGQVDVPETGVLTSRVLEAVGEIARAKPGQLILADNRHSLRGFPPVVFKMNVAELAALTGTAPASTITEIALVAVELARRNGRFVFVTLAERGLVAAAPDGHSEHLPALPVRGELDIVGAGDAVSANLTAALAAGATLPEALELANAGASIVVHQLGTTGSATVAQLRALMLGNGQADGTADGGIV
ncbi:MAG: carbohydrate kinase [Verrucomicrobiae bacterium]|nr:carbohydrate kinase [Verrucomicrobiae bacterium]